MIFCQYSYLHPALPASSWKHTHTLLHLQLVTKEINHFKHLACPLSTRLQPQLRIANHLFIKQAPFSCTCLSEKKGTGDTSTPKWAAKGTLGEREEAEGHL